MTSRRPEHVAFQPLRYLDGAEGEQAGGFGLDVVGLDVEVVAGCVIDCLDDGDLLIIRESPRQCGREVVVRLRTGEIESGQVGVFQ